MEQEVLEQDIKTGGALAEDGGVLRKVLSWIVKNIKFFLIPGYRVKELTEREISFERTRSKRKFIRKFKNFLNLLGIAIIIVVVTMAVFSPWLSYYTFQQLLAPTPGQFDPPSPEHPLGQTSLGRDVLGRIIWGARASLSIALPAIMFSVIFGVIIGTVAGYFGGWVDSIIMRIMDIFLAFPGLILAMVFIAIWGQRIEYIMLAYGIIGIPFYSRLIRASVIQSKELPYVEAARTSGAGKIRIMFRHIMPNCIQPVIISFTFQIGGMILGLAGLSFLGFGDPSLIEWGNDIADARGHLYVAPWATVWPGVAIFFTVLGFMLFGDGLRDALDPKLKNL